MSLQLQLETTNCCDAACTFCPHSRMRRPKGTMDLALSKRILEEAATIPVIDHLTFTGLGEPLLDRFLVERIRDARRLMPGIRIDLTTDGSFLRPKMVDALIDAGLTQLNVSLNAVDAEKRKAIMGIDNFDQVVASIRYAMQAGAGRMHVVVKGVYAKDLYEDGDKERFCEQWGGPVELGGSAFLHAEGNWAGTMWPMRVTPTRACGRALGQFMVLWDGRVALCCQDAEGDVILGDLNTQSIREVYNSAAYVGLREAHVQGRRRELPLCGTCTSM